MKYICVTRSDCHGGCIQSVENTLDFLKEELAEAEVGTEIKLFVQEMTPEEFEAIPEFQGW